MTGQAAHQTEAVQWEEIKERVSKIFSRVYFIHAFCTRCASNFSFFILLISPCNHFTINAVIATSERHCPSVDKMGN